MLTGDGMFPREVRALLIYTGHAQSDIRTAQSQVAVQTHELIFPNILEVEYTIL